MVVDVHLMIVAHRLFLIKAYRICNILSTTFSYYLSIISTKAGTPCFHSVPAFFVFTGSVYLLHQSTYSILTPHRFVRLLFGKTSQNWCSCGVVPQMPFEIRPEFHRICVSILHFTAQSASSWGCHRRTVISLYFLILLYTARVDFYPSIYISTQAFIRTVSFGV